MSSKFNQSMCTGIGDIIIKDGKSYEYKIPLSGSVSGAAFVTGYYDGTKWYYSGNLTNVGVYATTMEWTMFPEKPVGSPPTTTTDHSVGMTNIDLSAVNGFNFSASLNLTSPAICSTASRDSQGNAQPAIYQLFSGTIAQLPESNIKLSSQCPTDELLTDSANRFQGCLSPCKLAIKQNLNNQDLICCTGTYNNSNLCTTTTFKWQGGTTAITHAELPYVQNLASPITKNVYRWQFDDYVGDFSCQPDASFNFDIRSASRK